MEFDKLKQMTDDLGTKAALTICDALDDEKERQLGTFLLMQRIGHHLGLSLHADVQIMHHLAGRWPDGSPGLAAESKPYRLRVNVAQRWFCVKAHDEGLAWTGSGWDQHIDGMPAGRAQICNFNSKSEAEQYAEEHIRD